MKKTLQRPSVFTLFTIILTLSGAVYNAVRLVYGSTPAAFIAMSAISTALAVFLFIIIALKISEHDDEPAGG